MNRAALCWVMLSNLMGGASYVGTAFALDGLAPAAVVFWRTLLGGALFLPLLRKVDFHGLSRREWAQMAGVGVLGMAAPLLVGAIGQQQSTATNAALLVGIEPVSIVLLSVIFLGEQLTPRRLVAIGAGVFGSSLIILQGLPFVNARFTPSFNGDLLLFLEGFLASLYTVIGKDVLKKVDPTLFSIVTTVFALPLIGACAAVSGLTLPPREAIAGVVFLAIGVTFLGMLSWNKALELAPASQLATFIFLQPLIGVILAMLLRKETITPWSGAGGALILFGIYAATTVPRGDAGFSTVVPSWTAWARRFGAGDGNCRPAG